MKQAFRAGLWPGIAVGVGLFVSMMVWMFVVAGPTYYTTNMLVTFSTQAMWFASVLIGTLAGVVGAPHATTRTKAILGGLLSGMLGTFIAVVLTVIGTAIAFNGAPRSASLEQMSFEMGPLIKAFAFSFAGAASGAVAALVRSGRTGAGDDTPLANVLASPAPRRPAEAAAFAAPVAPAPMPVQAGPATLVQCPRCGTRIQAPAHRPVDLVCPTCMYRGTLRS